VFGYKIKLNITKCLFKHHVKNIYIEYCKNLSKSRNNIVVLEIKRISLRMN